MNPSTTKPKTRSDVKCPIFGWPERLKENILPTYEEVFKHYLHFRNELKPSEFSKDPNFSDISAKVVDKILSIWDKASIPTVTRTRVVAMLKSYHTSYMKLLKQPKNRLADEKYLLKLGTFKSHARENLFDICSGKCATLPQCSCPKDRKVPRNEITFLEDQRALRQMVIGAVDPKTTEIINARIIRKSSQSVFMSKQESFYSSENYEMDVSPPVEDVNLFDEEWDVPKVLESSVCEKKGETEKMLTPLPTLARTCDRFGISDRAGSMLASAELEDIGVVKKKDTCRVYLNVFFIRKISNSLLI